VQCCYCVVLWGGGTWGQRSVVPRIAKARHGSAHPMCRRSPVARGNALFRCRRVAYDVIRFGSAL
jgi:hypothetical protein